jgi:hypothetical protein
VAAHNGGRDAATRLCGPLRIAERDRSAREQQKQQRATNRKYRRARERAEKHEDGSREQQFLVPKVHHDAESAEHDRPADYGKAVVSRRGRDRPCALAASHLIDEYLEAVVSLSELWSQPRKGLWILVNENLAHILALLQSQNLNLGST